MSIGSCVTAMCACAHYAKMWASVVCIDVVDSVLRVGIAQVAKH